MSAWRQRWALLASALLVPTGLATAISGGAASAATGETDQVVVTSANFEGDTYAPWTRSGSVTLSVEGSDGGHVLRVANRTADYDGIQSEAGVFEPGRTYHVKMRVRLADGVTGSTSVRMVGKPAYDWIGNTTVSAAAWSTVEGDWTVPGDATAADTQLYVGSDAIAGQDAYDYLVDDIVVTGPPDGVLVHATGFETGLGDWVARAGDDSPPTVATTAAEAHVGTHAALVSARTSTGDGIGLDLTGQVEAGKTYRIGAWVKVASGQPGGELWASMRRTVADGDHFDQVKTGTVVSSSHWTYLEGSYAVDEAGSYLLYFETKYNGGLTSDFLVDDVSIVEQVPLTVSCDPSLKGSADFRVGVAIDSRETTGQAADLVACQFDQVTPENFMKPEAWYGDDHRFVETNAEADALMTYARDHDLDVYGHTLVWHSQTPAWFFQHEDGTELTDSDADKALLLDRMRTHIGDVARYLSAKYGAFGSDGNPLVAFDVVNEVVADTGENADGLRRSPWYRTLGADYIAKAFEFADEAFNRTYAAEGTDRPVKLFINDYNTEQAGKRARLHSLVAGLLADGVPVDGVGHQFHVNLSMPVKALDDALSAFEDLDVKQAVTELDVTTGVPVTDANLIEQGYYYRDAFRTFRAHAGDLFSVTVWGLNDARSWRNSSGAPLLFDDRLQPKLAFTGAVDGQLPPHQRTALVFGGDVPVTDAGLASVEWRKLPLHQVEGAGAFQLRWHGDTMTAYVEVADGDVDAADAVDLVVGDQTYTVGRDGTATGGVQAVARATEGGYRIEATLPIGAGHQAGDNLAFNVAIHDGATVTGWSTGTAGTLTLVEPLSYTEVVEASTAPAIDGEAEGVWDDAHHVTTTKEVGTVTSGATADVSTLWKGNKLYVLAHVTDPTLDASGSDPWVQDSVEIFLDAGNAKNGPYRDDDTQIRISYLNQVSFGTGDEAAQRARVESKTTTVGDGYVVEAAISLLEAGGLGTFHGVDFQVNDATGGVRTAIRNWADPTGNGYQSTSRWGVARLVGRAEPGLPTLSVGRVTVAYGRTATVPVTVTGPAGVTPTGTVQIRRGATVLGSAPVVRGVARVVLAKRSLLPASYTLTAAYSGDARLAATSMPFTLRVAKGSAHVRATLTRHRVKVRKGRATLRVFVTGEDAPASGRLTVKAAGRTIRVTLRGGHAVVRLPKFGLTGRKVVRVRYSGDATTAPASTRVVLRVVR